MNKVDFSYNDNKYFVQCNNDDKMKDIIDKFLTKSVKSKKMFSFYVICPSCKENAFISIKNFNISIKDCPSEHKTEDIHLNEFDKTQYIDQSKIKCDICQSLKCDIAKNKFFICNTCKQYLCPRCKDKHDKSHFDNIKDYDENQFYCKLHSNAYICYCSDCKKDLCDLCHNEHKEHKLIIYDSIMPDIEAIRNNGLMDT